MHKPMKNERQIKYFLYARRSVEERNGEKVVSIESQTKEMRELAEQHGLKIVATFTETKSAKEPYVRAEFEKMMDQIQKGKANGILVWKMDRLARNPIDEGRIKYFLQNGTIQNIRASDRDWYPDDNVLLASVEFGVATQYSRDLAKHIKRGLRAKVESGHRPAIAPIGYKNSKYRDKGRETVLVDEEKFPLVRKLFDLALTGTYSILQLMKIANEELGLRTRGTSRYPPKTLSKGTMYNLFINAFYCGEFEYPEGSGKRYTGKHTPMITKVEFDQLQIILKDRGRPRKRAHEFAFTNTMKCGECGAYITAEEKWKHLKNGGVNRHVYYRCTKRVDSNCSQMPIKETFLEEQIKEILKELCIPKQFHEWALAELEQLEGLEKISSKNVVKVTEQSLKVCNEKLSKLLEMRLSGELSIEEYASVKIKYEEERRALEKAIENNSQSVDSDIQKIKEKLTFAESIVKRFEKGDLKVKREILKNIGLNHVLKDRKLYVAIQKPLLIIKELKALLLLDKNTLEPRNTFKNKDILKDFIL